MYIIIDIGKFYWILNFNILRVRIVIDVYVINVYFFGSIVMCNY